MITLIDEDGVKKTLKDFSLAALPNHEHEAIPETIDRTLSVPGRNGLLYYDSTLGIRSFIIPVIVTPQDNKIKLQSKIRNFSSFIFNRYGKPKKLKLIFDYEADVFYEVRFASRMTPERLYTMARFDLTLVAYDPLPQSLMTNNDVTWGSTAITFNSGYLLGHQGGNTFNITGPKTVSVTMSGSQAIYPKIRVTGNGTNVSIKANGQSFSLGTFSNTEWIIDGNDFTVQKNGITDFLVESFLELFHGDNDITINGSNLNLTLKVTFRDKYL